MADIPAPECRQGYTQEQLEAVLGVRLDEFDRWMRGQTCSICDGRTYSHETRQHSETGCGPHGVVVYPWDLKRFIDGLPVID